MKEAEKKDFDSTLFSNKIHVKKKNLRKREKEVNFTTTGVEK